MSLSRHIQVGLSLLIFREFLVVLLINGGIKKIQILGPRNKKSKIFSSGVYICHDFGMLVCVCWGRRRHSWLFLMLGVLFFVFVYDDDLNSATSIFIDFLSITLFCNQGWRWPKVWMGISCSTESSLKDTQWSRGKRSKNHRGRMGVTCRN